VTPEGFVLSALWSAKGGAGTTTTAVALADNCRRGHRGTEALLVDLAGDLPAALGLPDPDLGATEWLASDAGPEALTRIEHGVADGVSLLPLGNTSEWSEARATALAVVLGADHRDVIVDVGLLGAPTSPLAVLRELVTDSADRSLLVTRSCYLALRRAARCDRTPDGVILVREPGRALDRGDVEGLLSVPVLAEVDADPAVARAIDAGLLLTSGPRHVARSLRRVA
jgi:Mrp family chromosome partitioning ATPase